MNTKTITSWLHVVEFTVTNQAGDTLHERVYRVDQTLVDEVRSTDPGTIRVV